MFPCISIGGGGRILFADRGRVARGVVSTFEHPEPDVPTHSRRRRNNGLATVPEHLRRSTRDHATLQLAHVRQHHLEEPREPGIRAGLQRPTVRGHRDYAWRTVRPPSQQRRICHFGEIGDDGGRTVTYESTETNPGCD